MLSHGLYSDKNIMIIQKLSINKNIMYEDCRIFTEPSKIKDTRIYEILSQITNNISFLFSEAYKIIILGIQNQNRLCLSSISSFEDKISSYFSLVDLDINHLEINKIMQKRLINRIFDIIVPYKQEVSQRDYLKPLQGLITQIQNSIREFYEHKSLSLLIKHFQSNFKAFWTILKILENYQSSEILRQTNLHFGKHNQHTTFSPQKTTLPQQESEATKRFKKFLNAINKRYKAINITDLDFKHFRSSHFEAKNSEEQLREDCIKRNRQIRAQIFKYKKGHEEYLKRKQKKIFQKNMSLNDKQVRTTQSNFKQLNFLPKRINTKVEKKGSAILQGSFETQTKFEQKKRFSLNQNRRQYEVLSPTKKKTQIKMKSILIMPDINKGNYTEGSNKNIHLIKKSNDSFPMKSKKMGDKSFYNGIKYSLKY